MHDTAYAKAGPGLEAARSIGLNKPLPINQLDAEKAHMLKMVANWRQLVNCAEFCQFVPWSQMQIEAALNAVTGWNTSLLEYMRVSERVVTLLRLFNLREGFTEDDDYLPKRFYQGLLGEGPLKGTAVNRQAADVARKAYYNLMGWDETGNPTATKLAELDLLWAKAE
jgi:aldehyde:ferredoxin oxidoreductase